MAKRKQSREKPQVGSARLAKKHGRKKAGSRKTPSRTQTKKQSKRAAAVSPEAKSTEGTTEPDAKIRHESECVVVGIGASAGGLEAYKTFLQAMPHDSGMALVLIQHLDPDHESLMADLLSKYTVMPVVQACNASALKPDHVYMIPPNKFIKLRDGGLFLDDPVKQRGLRMPIDYFFRSLAEQRQGRAVGIILSGTGSDGSSGLKEIKAQGGMVMVQDPESADYDGMPRSALSTGMVDFVCDIREMPDGLVKYVKHPYITRGHDGEPTLLETAPDHYKSILNLLQAHTDYDFRCYKRGTLSRRIQRRMGLRHVEQIADYLGLLRKENNELDLLFKDLLISVTAFFREKGAWSALQDEVIAQLVRRNKLDQPIRVWVAGCATGEEAYSIAILLYEQLEVQNKNLDVQIFATDLDEDAVDVARQGIYPSSIAADVSPSRIRKFFQEEGERYRVNKRLRESCVFAVQNLIGDPPFSNLDLISCRNVMIYLEQDVQNKMIQMFHFALREGGYLFQGTSESIGKHTKLYEPVSQQWRIYRKRGLSRRTAANFPIMPTGTQTEEQSAAGKPSYEQPSGSAELARKVLLEKFAPASVLINHRYEVQYFHGPVRNYLDIPSGEPTTDLTAMCLQGLRSRVRGLIHKVLNDGGADSVTAPRVKRNGNTVAVRIDVEPLPRRRGTEPMLLVTFIDEQAGEAALGPPASSAPVPDSEDPQTPSGDGDGKALTRSDAGNSGPVDHLVEQLEYELQATREDLQSTIEELETSNEELKASNEEVMSMNEELQSTNEELETSREELQSLNEELSTVNSQLEEKVSELENSNNDLHNLLASTEIATIFLDTDFRIRRFTPATTELLHVIPGDIGRPITDLSPRFNDPQLFDDARTVLQKLAPIEREVYVTGGHPNLDSALPPDGSTQRQCEADHQERWFIRRILPYRTSDNKIDGVVIVFGDVSRLKESARKLERRERQTAVLAQLGRAALTAGELQPLLDRAVEQIAETLDNEFCKVLKLLPGHKELLLKAGIGWEDGLVGEKRVGAGLDSQAGYTLEVGGPVIVADLSREKRFSGPQLLCDHGVISGMSVAIGPQDNPWGVLGTHTARRSSFTVDDANFLQAVANTLWEAIKRLQSEQQFRALVDASAQIVWTTNADGQGVEDSPSWRNFTAQTYEQWKDFGWLDALHPDDREQIEKLWRTAVATNTPVDTEYRLRHASGQWRWTAVRAVPLTESDGAVRGWVGMNIDITQRKEAEQKLRQLAETLERQVEERAGMIKVLHDITSACHHASNIDEAIGYVLRAFSHYNGWCFGHAFHPADDNPDQLVSFMECYEEVPGRFKQFREATARLRLNRNEGLPGRVYVTGQAEFITSGLAAHIPHRGTQIDASDIKSAAAFPVRVGDEVVAVLEFYSDKPQQADPRTLEAIESIGSQLGRVVERTRLQREIADLASREQQRIGNELHDTVIQQLTGSEMMAESLRQRIKAGKSPEETDLANLVQTLKDAQRQVRRLHRGLMPVEVDAAGLMSALEQLAVSTTRMHNVQCDFRCDQVVLLQNTMIATYLYRIAQEAVHNAVKHADPAEITISLSGGDRIRLTVNDDGAGLSKDLSELSTSGIRIMRYRAEVIGGQLEIDSKQGKGTTVSCTVPN